jgi:ribosomal protein L36
VCMSKRSSKPHKEPARPPSTEKLISFQSDTRIIKRRGRIFVAERITKISEITTTNNNLIQFPVK